MIHGAIKLYYCHATRVFSVKYCMSSVNIYQKNTKLHVSYTLRLIRMAWNVLPSAVLEGNGVARYGHQLPAVVARGLGGGGPPGTGLYVHAVGHEHYLVPR